MARVRLTEVNNSLSKEVDEALKNLNSRRISIESDNSPKKESDSYNHVFGTGYIYGMNESRNPNRRSINWSSFSKTPGATAIQVSSGYDYDILDSLVRDGYVYKSMDLYSAAILSQGYDMIGSKNDVKYVNEYLERIEVESGLSIKDYIRKALWSIRKYGICYTAFSRSNNKENAWVDSDNLLHRPITGFFVEDARTMRILFKNRPFKISGFVQRENNALSYSVPSGYKSFANQSSNYLVQVWNNLAGLKKAFPVWTPVDMIYTSVPTEGGSIFPMPPLYPAIDDMRSLRDIESILDMVIYQYGSPLVHVTADIDELDKARMEADKVINKLQRMEANGMISSSDKIKINVVDLKKDLADLKEYLHYYTNRLLTDIGVTAAAVGSGESSSRATADIELKVIKYNVEMYQDVLLHPLNNIIHEILQTKYPNKRIPRDKVRFKFNRVDVNQKIQEESHAANLYNFGILTRTEARELLGYPEIDTDEKDTIFYQKELTGNEDLSGMSKLSMQNTNKLGSNQYGDFDPKKSSVNNTN